MKSIFEIGFLIGSIYFNPMNEGQYILLDIWCSRFEKNIDMAAFLNPIDNMAGTVQLFHR
jgi:hypothetical protein